MGKQSKSEPHAARCHRWGLLHDATGGDSSWQRQPWTTQGPLGYHLSGSSSQSHRCPSVRPPKAKAHQNSAPHSSQRESPHPTLANQEFALCSPKSRARPGRKSPPLGNGHGRSLLMLKSRPLRTGAAFWPEIRAINYFAGVIIAIEMW